MFLIVHAKALLRGALGQQSAVILICMAVDRYMCALHPEKYHQLSSKKVSYVLFIAPLLVLLRFLFQRNRVGPVFGRLFIHLLFPLYAL